MKMLSFVIALGVLYWTLSALAQSMIGVSAPCPAAAETGKLELSSAGGSRAEIAKMSGRWGEGEDYRVVLLSEDDARKRDGACID